MRRRNTVHGGGTGYSGYSAPGWGHGWGRLRKEGEKLNEAREAASAWRQPVSPNECIDALGHAPPRAGSRQSVTVQKVKGARVAARPAALG